MSVGICCLVDVVPQALKGCPGVAENFVIRPASPVGRKSSACAYTTPSCLLLDFHSYL